MMVTRGWGDQREPPKQRMIKDKKIWSQTGEISLKVLLYKNSGNSQLKCITLYS